AANLPDPRARPAGQRAEGALATDGGGEGGFNSTGLDPQSGGVQRDRLAACRAQRGAEENEGAGREGRRPGPTWGGTMADAAMEAGRLAAADQRGLGQGPGRDPAPRGADPAAPGEPGGVSPRSKTPVVRQHSGANDGGDPRAAG